MPPLIRTEKVSKFYNTGKPEEVQALIDIDLEIPQGSYVLINGPSGSGKSTLLSILGTIDRASKGRLFLYGENASRYSDVQLSKLRRQSIGFVFQSFNLLPRLSAWENVSFPLIPLGISSKERYRRATELIDLVGLKNRIHHTPQQMSGGEQQRVAFARALINNPEILIADEPTSNIDAETISHILKILVTLKDQGKTIIVSSHDPIFLNQAETILTLKNGQLEIQDL